MKTMRATFRLIAFSLLTLSLAGIWLSGRGLAGLFAQGAWRWRNYLSRCWARGVLRLLNIEIQQRGVPPRAPFFLVANHLSFIDVVVLLSRCDACFVAKQEVRAWPVLGWLSRQLGTIFINRERKRDLLRVNALLTQALHAGQSIVLFPEGTTTPGAVVLPFKSGLLEPVVRAGQAVSCASLFYRTPIGSLAAAEAVCWWGPMEFMPHFWQMLKLPGFSVALEFAATSYTATNRKILARQLHTMVADGLATQQQLMKAPVNDCGAPITETWNVTPA